MPTRHVRSRAKGSRLPQGVVCVTRPGKWGNPFATAAEFRAAWQQCERLRCVPDDMDCVAGQRILWMIEHISDIRDKDLACWCKCGKQCHADALIEFANRGVTACQTN